MLIAVHSFLKSPQGSAMFCNKASLTLQAEKLANPVEEDMLILLSIESSDRDLSEDV